MRNFTFNNFEHDLKLQWSRKSKKFKFCDKVSLQHYAEYINYISYRKKNTIKNHFVRIHIYVIN